MANCRINNLKPSCGYVLPGITEVGLIDFDDFRGFVFSGEGAVTEVLRDEAIVPVGIDGARYSSEGAKVVSHRLETFVPGLDASLVNQLNLATRRRYVVFFRTAAGTYHVFGWDTGATLSYNLSTDTGGAALAFTARSRYPLYSVAPETFRASDWILETGVWDILGKWYNNEIWKSI